MGNNGYTNKYKTISLPKLNGIQPTLESTVIKLSEEVGELARLIGKGQRMSMENNQEVTEMQANWLGEIVEELLDVAQTTITMAFKLEDDFGVSLEEGLDRHIDKLKRKNYLIS